MNIYKVTFHNKKAVSSARIDWNADYRLMADLEIGINSMVIYALNEYDSIMAVNALFQDAACPCSSR